MEEGVGVVGVVEEEAVEEGVEVVEEEAVEEGVGVGVLSVVKVHRLIQKYTWILDDLDYELVQRGIAPWQDEKTFSKSLVV